MCKCDWINEFYFFWLCEKFIEKANLQSFLVRKDDIILGVKKMREKVHVWNVAVYDCLPIDVYFVSIKIFVWVCHYVKEKVYSCVNM